MIEEIADEITRKVASATKFLSSVLDDGETSNPKDFEDDNFIHISRGKYRFVFYNGQDEGRFTQKDVKRFAKLVDNILNNTDNSSPVRYIKKEKHRIIAKIRGTPMSNDQLNRLEKIINEGPI